MKVIPISGVIGMDVTANEIRSALASASGQAVVLEISSPGGFVTDALEIFNLVKRHVGGTTAKLMGLAASAASYISCAAQRTVAEANAVFMIHGAEGVCVGNSEAMEKMRNILSGFSELLARAYAEKSGKPINQVLQLMSAETWLFSDQAREAGFVDEVLPGAGRLTDKPAALAAARDAVASARSRQTWSEGYMEKAVALLGGLPQSRPDQDIMAAITAKGWEAADVAFAVKHGVSLEDIAQFGPRVDARENAARIAAHDQRRW
jgi:ATP-dependent Clp protease protease subunit